LRNKGKSAIADHGLGPPKHDIDWEGVEILQQESDHYLREIKEGLLIQQSKSPLVNAKPGLILNSTWQPMIPTLKQETGKQISTPNYFEFLKN
jgi:hypothetical protein